MADNIKLIFMQQIFIHIMSICITFITIIDISGLRFAFITIMDIMVIYFFDTEHGYNRICIIAMASIAVIMVFIVVVMVFTVFIMVCIISKCLLIYIKL